MGLFETLFAKRPRDGETLYAAVVAQARQPHWYLQGSVPDTAEGRFEMIVAILAMAMIELDVRAMPAAGVRLTENFIADMDGQLREAGVGDVGIGKNVGQMMSMLGGRLGAYREGLAQGDLGSALIRNLYRTVDPGPDAVGHVIAGLDRLRGYLSGLSDDVMLGGQWQ